MSTQFIYSVLSRGVFSLFSLGYLWLFGAHLTTQDFAYFALFDSYRLFAGNVPTWGSAQAFIRQANQIDNCDLAFPATIAIQTTWLFISLAVLLASTIILSHIYPLPFAPIEIILSIAFFMVGYFLYQLIKSFFLSRQDSRAVFCIELFLVLSFSAFVVLTVTDVISINVFRSIHILAVCYMCTNIICVVVFRPFRGISLGAAPILWRAILTQLHYIKHSVPNNLAANFVNVIDTTIIFYALGPASTAAYKAAKIFASCYVVLAEAFNYTLFPALSRYDSGSFGAAREKLRASKKMAWLILIPVSVTVFLFGQPLLSLLYHGKYDQAQGMHILLSCLAIWGIGFVLNRLDATFLGALGYPHILLHTTLITAASGTLALAILAEYLGLAGCGFGLLITLGISTLLLRHYVLKIAGNSRYG